MFSAFAKPRAFRGLGRRLLVPSLVALVASLAGGSFIALGVDPMTFYACINRQGGLYNVVVSPSLPQICKQGDVAVTWNEGAVGPQGPTGATGPAGPVGPRDRQEPPDRRVPQAPWVRRDQPGPWVRKGRRDQPVRRALTVRRERPARRVRLGPRVRRAS